MEQLDVLLKVLSLFEDLGGVVICCFGISQTADQVDPDQDKMSAGRKHKEQLAYCFCSTFNPCCSHEAFFGSDLSLRVVGVPLGTSRVTDMIKIKINTSMRTSSLDSLLST
jgi:hypothetical protein